MLVFDNGSTDSSPELAQGAGAEVVIHPVRGKGNLLRHVFDRVDADAYVLVDADDTYPAKVAPELVSRLFRDRLDLLIGARLERSERGAFRPFHRLGTG